MNVFTTVVSEAYANLCLLIVRVSVSSFMLTHGIPKLGKLTSGNEIQFADPFGFGPAFSLVLVVFAEVVCAVFIMLGLGTRLATIPLIIAMSVAAFHAHATDPFGTKEKPLLFLLVYIVLLVFGSGKFSIDRLISKK